MNKMGLTCNLINYLYFSVKSQIVSMKNHIGHIVYITFHEVNFAVCTKVFNDNMSHVQSVNSLTSYTSTYSYFNNNNNI